MVDLTGINVADKNSNVQYSYPIAKISKGSDQNTFYLNFYGFTQNFSASFKIGVQDTYISGICTKAIITGKSHKVGDDTHNAELVLEHKKSDNMPFYVVFPLKFGESASQVDRLFDQSLPDQVIDLNENLKSMDNKMVCYKDSENSNPYVFVFKTPITVGVAKPSGLTTFPKFNGILKAPESTKKNAKQIRWATNLKGANTQDEVECEYTANIDENKPPADKTMVLNIMYWFFAFLLMTFSFLYGLTWISNNKLATEPQKDTNVKTTIFGSFIGIGVLFFIIFVSLFFTKSMNIHYGATSIFSLVIVALSSYALIGGLVKTPLWP